MKCRGILKTGFWLIAVLTVVCLYPFRAQAEDVRYDLGNLSLGPQQVSSTEVYTGSVVLVSTHVENEGPETEYNIELTVNGVSEQVKSISIEAEASKFVQFNLQFDEPGEYTVQIENLSPHTITVTEGWAQYIFSANKNSTGSFFSGPDTSVVEEKWLFSLNESIVSSPAVVNGVAYFGALDNVVYALDTETGEKIWDFETGDDVRSSPAVVGDTLFIGSNDGNVYGLDVTTGDELMRIEIGSPVRSSPLIIGNTLYISLFDEENGSVIAHDIKVNDRVWSFKTGASIASSPAYANGILYVGSNDNHIYALDATGSMSDEDRVIWSLDTGQSVTATPTIVDGVVYVGNSTIVGNGTFYALDALDGTELWSILFNRSIVNSATVDGNMVYVASSEKLFALDKTNGNEIWNFIPEVDFGTVSFGNSSPVVTEEMLYIGTRGSLSANRRMYGLDKITGQPVWDFSTGYVGATPAVVDGTLYIGTTNHGFSAIQNEEPYDVFVDNEFSELTAQTPRWANGRDGSRVSFSLRDQKNRPISLPLNDINIELPAHVTYTGVQEDFNEGDYFFTMSTTTPSDVSPVVRVDGVEVEHYEIVEFRDTTSSWRVNIGAVWDEFEEIEFMGAEASHLTAVEFTDNAMGWAIGANGTIIHTESAGEKWVVQQSGTNQDLIDLSFIDSETGWIAGSNGTLLATRNGGQTWELRNSGTNEHLSSVWFINEKQGWASNPDGLILKTEDGGESWSQHSIDFQYSFSNLQTIQFIDSNTGWATAGRDGLLKTEDGGESWQHIIGNTDFWIDDVQFIDEKTGWIAGGSWILHTSDGGKTWNSIYDGVWTETIQRISVADSLHGMAFGNLGGILRTDDGGKSWKLEYAGDANLWISDVFHTDPETAWAVSPLGTVLNYKAGTGGIPVVSASNSAVSATSPHLADGSDSATITVDLRDSFNAPVEGFTVENIILNLSGDAKITGGKKTEKPSVFQFEVVNSTPETVTVQVVVNGTELDDSPQILFGMGVRPYDLTVSETEEGLELAWQAGSESQINSFILYKGNSISDLHPADTLQAETKSYLDETPLEGTTYYAVSSVNSAGNESLLSKKVSYLNSSLVATGNWKLASIPLSSGGIEAENAAVFSFHEQYNSVSSLEPAKGYWVKSKTYDDENIPAKGQGLDQSSVQLYEGWNLIGSLADTISVNSIADSSGILTETPVFSYTDGAYQLADSLVPHKGYWIFASDSGKVDLSVYIASAGQKAKQKRKEEENKESIRNFITLSSEGKTKKLWLADSGLSREEKYPYYLPPFAPEPGLDIRTSAHQNIADRFPVKLHISAASFPVTIGLNDAGEDSEYAYRLTVTDDKKQYLIDLLPGETHQITKASAHYELTKVHMDDIITEPKLLPNYPNPFSPETTIQYQVHASSNVKIEVYDILGRLVQVLVDETQLTGQYKLPFDGSRYASGIYLVRLHVDDFVDIRKITLIK